MNIQAAGATLDSCARIGIAATAFLESDRRYAEHINLLIYFTKTAIITNWLQLLDQSCSDSRRAIPILQEFERLTFLSLSIKGKSALNGQLRKLTDQVTELTRIGEDQTLTKGEATRRRLLWSKNWLGSIFEDGNLLKRMSPIYGTPLSSYVLGSVQLLGKSVEAVVTGKDIV